MPEQRLNVSVNVSITTTDGKPWFNHALAYADVPQSLVTQAERVLVSAVNQLQAMGEKLASDKKGKQ